MSKYGKTKSEILKLIMERKDTLSTISSELGLAPSTVSKHLNELQGLGAIRLVESEYAKKWKHYELNAGFEGEFPETIAAKINYSRGSKSKYAFACFLAIAAIAGLLILSGSFQATSANVPIAITDPPYLPAGTSAVMLNYSSILINYSYGGANETITLNTSGTLDALNLVNVSKIIATANIKSGSKINGVSINISSGSITIGNSTYALAIPVKRFYTEVLGNGTVNSSTSILLDLSSVVVPYFPNHSNATESFAFMPKLSSVLGYVNKLQMPGNMAGAANKAFEENESMPLDEFGRNAAFLRSISSVKVANASISRSGGNEDLSISLINTGNNIAIVEGVAILSCFFIPDYAISSGMRHGGHGNATTYNATSGTLTINISRLYRNWNSKRIYINVTHITHKVVITGNPYSIANMLQLQRPMLGISFGVLDNGSLSSALWGMPEMAGDVGYGIGPNSAVGLKYSTANGSMQGRALNSISQSGNYRIIIMTSNGIAVYDSDENGTSCG
jgi:DNA-binding transcriptional ArsR family regulator